MEKIQQAIERNQHPSVEDLRSITLFRDLPDDGLAWLANCMVAFELSAGDMLFRAGTPATYLMILFEGEIRAERQDGRVYTARPGQAAGLLPYSRLTHMPSNGYAELDSRGALLHKDCFPEMLERMPVLRERLVNALADRIRETAKVDQQAEKLAALGKMAAGLAHELNNPAAAAQRAVYTLRHTVSALRAAHRKIEELGLDRDARIFLADVDCNWAKNAGPAKALDTLERSEREEELVVWLKAHSIPDPWELATALPDTGCTTELLDEVATRVPPQLLRDVLCKLLASFSVTRLIDEISSSTAKISELIEAIKEYSYMDQSPEQEVDIHQGIENTLIMLKHRLKKGVEVVRRYDDSIPKITAHGSQLNQVWTNLISNAVDAMNGQGKLLITTQRESRAARVDIVDNGPGIPADIADRVFEPFFTTKPLGEGTGLGLDAVYRIVQVHRGRVTFESRPGETRFIVRIPFGNGVANSAVRAS